MSIKHLTAAEREIVRQALVALRNGRYLDDADIGSRIGVAPSIYDATVEAWPAVDDGDDDSDITLIINNGLNEVCHGVHIPEREWPRWFTVARGEVKATYQKWAIGRGWTHTGVR